MSIEQIILFNIRRKINLKDKIIIFFLRKYTLNIYKMGYNDGYNFKDVGGWNKAEKIKKYNKIIKMKKL